MRRALQVILDNPTAVFGFALPDRIKQRPGLGVGVHLLLGSIKRDLRQALEHLRLRFRHQPGKGGANRLDTLDVEFDHLVYSPLLPRLSIS